MCRLTWSFPSVRRNRRRPSSFRRRGRLADALAWQYLASASITNRVRVAYSPATPGGAVPEAPPFTATYQEGTRSLEIKFAKPLERFQTVKVELLEGITSMDGQPLGVWTLTFTTGG